MIRTVAELLTKVLHEALPTLDASAIKHAPTIGDMYEGLSKEVLERAIPEGVYIQVVSGFATDDRGRMSGQLDCMLVRGNGKRIPYTDSFVWHIKDIIAVIEVKKTLRKQQMREAIDQLGSVKHLEDGLMDAPYTQNVDLTPAFVAFSETTGRVARVGQIKSLSLGDRAILNALAEEQLSTIRIVLGLHGYKSEAKFRSALLELLKDRIGTSDFSPPKLPQLIISGNYSLVKANGRPYSARLVDNEWPIYFSTPVNPLVVLLEVIWSKLDELYELTDPWGEDLEVEVPRGLLLVWRVAGGWYFREIDASDDQLKSTPIIREWKPAFVTEEELVIVHRMMIEEVVRIDDQRTMAWVEEHGLDIISLRDKLVDAGITAVHGKELRLITRNCMSAVMPTGHFVIADNNSGRLSRWLDREAKSGWTGQYGPAVEPQ